MPKTKKEKLLFALLTVMITVPCFVVYCLSIENNGILNIDPSFMLILIPIEFVLAYTSEIFIGSPLSLKLAFSKVNPKTSKPIVVETAIIISTVCIMCPLMSFLATILYKGIFPGLVFHETTFTFTKFLIQFIPNFLQTVVINFPFALLSQLFFIQPLVGKLFSKFISKSI